MKKNLLIILFNFYVLLLSFNFILSQDDFEISNDAELPTMNDNTITSSNDSTNINPPNPTPAPRDNTSTTNPTNESTTSATSSTSRRRTSSRSTISTIRGIGIHDDGEYGPYLVNDEGFTLYVNVKEAESNALCYDECTKKFPPAQITENQKIFYSDDIDDKLLMQIKADDGRIQLIYNNYPLYYYVKDIEPNDKKGVGLEDSWYLISPKGVLLKRDASGRIPQPRTNNTSSNIDTNSEEDVTSGSAGSSGKTLAIPGLASMMVIPDIFSIKFNITSQHANLTNALELMDDYLGKLNTTMSKIKNIEPNKIILIDQRINKNNLLPDYSITYIFNYVSNNTDLISNIVNLFKEFNLAIKNTINWELNYSLSPEYLTNVKSFLYGVAVKNAMENAFNTLDPINFTIVKDKPIKSITLDTTDLMSVMPFFNSNNDVLTPTLKRFNEMNVFVKVTVNYNII